jgi:proline iminopeptidase
VGPASNFDAESAAVRLSTEYTDSDVESFQAGNEFAEKYLLAEVMHPPSKQLVWFEHSAHEVMNEEPGKVLVSLIDYARPIAARTGDVATP